MTDDNDQKAGNPFSRRKVLIGGAAGIAAVATLGASCSSSSTGSAIGDNVGTMNDLVNQQSNLTIQAYNAVKDNPECQYPSKELKTSLELINQRKKLLRFNEPTKAGYIHLFSMGVLILTSTVIGKVSSCQSSMTSNTGVFLGTGNNGYPSGDNVPVDMPSDDISFGPNENGVFWFDENGVYMTWSGEYLYVDTELDIQLQPGLMVRPGSKPTASADQK